MMLKTRAHIDVFLEGDTGPEAHRVRQHEGEPPLVVLRIGNVKLFLQSRAQAESIFNAAAEAAGIWREIEPAQVTVDAVITHRCAEHAYTNDGQWWCAQCLRRLGRESDCTGTITSGSRQHDGASCPIHEPATRCIWTEKPSRLEEDDLRPWEGDY